MSVIVLSSEDEDECVMVESENEDIDNSPLEETLKVFLVGDKTEEEEDCEDFQSERNVILPHPQINPLLTEHDLDENEKDEDPFGDLDSLSLKEDETASNRCPSSEDTEKHLQLPMAEVLLETPESLLRSQVGESSFEKTLVPQNIENELKQSHASEINNSQSKKQNEINAKLKIIAEHIAAALNTNINICALNTEPIIEPSVETPLSSIEATILEVSQLSYDCPKILENPVRGTKCKLKRKKKELFSSGRSNLLSSPSSGVSSGENDVQSSIESTVTNSTVNTETVIRYAGQVSELTALNNYTGPQIEVNGLNVISQSGKTKSRRKPGRKKNPANPTVATLRNLVKSQQEEVNGINKMISQVEKKKPGRKPGWRKNSTDPTAVTFKNLVKPQKEVNGRNEMISQVEKKKPGRKPGWKKNMKLATQNYVKPQQDVKGLDEMISEGEKKNHKTKKGQKKNVTAPLIDGNVSKTLQQEVCNHSEGNQGREDKIDGMQEEQTTIRIGESKITQSPPDIEESFINKPMFNVGNSDAISEPEISSPLDRIDHVALLCTENGDEHLENRHEKQSNMQDRKGLNMNNTTDSQLVDKNTQHQYYKSEFVKLYHTIFDDVGEYICMRMGDLLLLVGKERMSYKSRLESANKLTCEQLRKKEIDMAKCSYQKILGIHRITFTKLFYEIYSRICNANVIVRQQRALLVAWFLKNFLRVAILCPEFEDSLHEMKCIVITLLPKNILTLPTVRSIFVDSTETDFEKYCHTVTECLQKCFDNVPESGVQENNNLEPAEVTNSSCEPHSNENINVLKPSMNLKKAVEHQSQVENSQELNKETLISNDNADDQSDTAGINFINIDIPSKINFLARQTGLKVSVIVKDSVKTSDSGSLGTGHESTPITSQNPETSQVTTFFSPSFPQSTIQPVLQSFTDSNKKTSCENTDLSKALEQRQNILQSVLLSDLATNKGHSSYQLECAAYAANHPIKDGKPLAYEQTNKNIHLLGKRPYQMEDCEQKIKKQNSLQPVNTTQSQDAYRNLHGLKSQSTTVSPYHSTPTSQQTSVEKAYPNGQTVLLNALQNKSSKSFTGTVPSYPQQVAKLNSHSNLSSRGFTSGVGPSHYPHTSSRLDMCLPQLSKQYSQQALCRPYTNTVHYPPGYKQQYQEGTQPMYGQKSNHLPQNQDILRATYAQQSKNQLMYGQRSNHLPQNLDIIRATYAQQSKNQPMYGQRSNHLPQNQDILRAAYAHHSKNLHLKDNISTNTSKVQFAQYGGGETDVRLYAQTPNKTVYDVPTNQGVTINNYNINTFMPSNYVDQIPIKPPPDYNHHHNFIKSPEQTKPTETDVSTKTFYYHPQSNS